MQILHTQKSQSKAKSNVLYSLHNGNNNDQESKVRFMYGLNWRKNVDMPNGI